jgi:hypothetical protein
LLLALLASACAPSIPSVQQEPVGTTVWLPSPNRENPVDLGTSLTAHPEFQAQAIAAIASVTQGKLPGVRFLVVHNPAYDPVRGIPCVSFRVPGRRAYIVLSWWESSAGTGENHFSIGNIPFEVEHLERAEDDGGQHVTDDSRSNFGNEMSRFFGLGG